MTEVGEIREIPKVFGVEWKIPNFVYSVPIDTTHKSPRFSFDNKSWILWIYPNGASSTKSGENIDIYLVDETKTPPKNLKVALGLKSFDKKKDTKMLIAKLVRNTTYATIFYLSRSELLQRKSELFPSGDLTVLCTLENTESIESPSDSAASKCSHCKELVDDKDISIHENMCVDKPIKCPECSNVVALKNWYDHKCQMAKAKATEKLLGDLKSVMVNGDHSDTIIQVKGEKFRLHRNILGARNPFFDSMFKSDMKEKKTGIVTIDNCNPDIFRSFIHFVYTGEVDKLSAENVCDLFKVADKYQENQLKEDCLQFMINSISIENFCDFIIVALKYDEKELLKNATKFFANNTKEIICNVKWLAFMQEHPVYANELHIKALDMHCCSS